MQCGATQVPWSRKPPCCSSSAPSHPGCSRFLHECRMESHWCEDVSGHKSVLAHARFAPARFPAWGAYQHRHIQRQSRGTCLPMRGISQEHGISLARGISHARARFCDRGHKSVLAHAKFRPRARFCAPSRFPACKISTFSGGPTWLDERRALILLHALS